MPKRVCCTAPLSAGGRANARPGVRFDVPLPLTLFAEHSGTGSRPSQALDRVYTAACSRATAGEGFTDEVLWQELRRHSIPDAYGDRGGKRVGTAFAAWDQRIPAKQFHRFLLKRGT